MTEIAMEDIEEIQTQGSVRFHDQQEFDVDVIRNTLRTFKIIKGRIMFIRSRPGIGGAETDPNETSSFNEMCKYLIRILLKKVESISKDHPVKSEFMWQLQQDGNSSSLDLVNVDRQLTLKLREEIMKVADSASKLNVLIEKELSLFSKYLGTFQFSLNTHSNVINLAESREETELNNQTIQSFQISRRKALTRAKRLSQVIQRLLAVDVIDFANSQGMQLILERTATVDAIPHSL